ncbi:DegT/DnrJ/EryC1/StrS family aminotransferase [Glaciecola siphonariae]|uniref:DegT/DnrJ/EryC1/StrS family aminotransferase n=1 Tax=Glaciecola siphonariae TaxID=521012 RepID=A0ABV9LWW5_9ALTE
MNRLRKMKVDTHHDDAKQMRGRVLPLHRAKPVKTPALNNNILLNKPLEPDLTKLHYWLNKIHENHWYSNFGPLHDELTQRLEDYLGVKNLLLVNNGTSALQVAGRALEVDSVISTPFSYVATASAFLWQKDDLVFSDIDQHSYNLCPETAENTLNAQPNTDAIVATHVYGNPCDVDAFDALCAKHHKKMIYDGAHAFGVRIKNRSVLSYGDASTLSFHATKLFHTVEGGAIIFKHAEDYENARSLISCGYKGGKIVGLGTNAKLNEYQAAVGLVNLALMDDVIAHRQALFTEYNAQLKDYLQLQQWHPDATFNGAYMPIVCDNDAQLARVQTALNERNIGSRTYFSPSLDELFNAYAPMKTSRDIAQRVLCLPLHFYMQLSEVKLICEIVKQCIK